MSTKRATARVGVDTADRPEQIDSCAGPSGKLCVGDGLGRHGAEPVDEPAGLRHGHERVVAPVDDEHGRGTRVNASDG